MKKIAIFVVLSLPFLAQSQNVIAMRDSIENCYRFWLYVPPAQYNTKTADSTKTVKENAETADSVKTLKPLIVFLHGKSLCGNNLYTVKRYGTIDALEMGRHIDAYVVAPQNPGGSWNPEKILKLIDWTTERHNIDTTRIYVLGMSLGGYGTINFVGTYPKKVAAAMALCGGASSLKSFCGLNEVPLWIIHGTADRSIAVSQSENVVKKMAECGDTSLLIFDKWHGVNHNILARLFYAPETYEWLFSHTLTDSVRYVNRNVSITQNILNTAYKDMEKRTVITTIDNNKSLDNTVAPNTTVASNATVHIVKKGDNLGKIAAQYRTSVATLCRLNKLTTSSILQIGQKIKVR